MSKNVVESETPQMTIWRMCIACWISKAIRTQSHSHAHAPTHAHTQKYISLPVFPQQQWFRERASLLRYTHIFSLVFLRVYRLKFCICFGHATLNISHYVIARCCLARSANHDALRCIISVIFCCSLCFMFIYSPHHWNVRHLLLVPSSTIMQNAK